MTDNEKTPATSTRERILDAFEALLGESGERAATLEAVAGSAGISKGGLLYHFGSKEVLIDGLLARLEMMVALDVAEIHSSEAGPVAHLIRTSPTTGNTLDRALVAVSRLAQASNSRARQALRAANEAWYEAVLETVGDPVLTRTIMLISDGLYYGAAFFPTDDPHPAATFDTAATAHQPDLEGIIALLETLTAIPSRTGVKAP
ncbi:TetR/AcrR family transcriptional regulator [Alpinimonas psychrophila]|uniref:AcrR family transcriptional regulator n=1 Tax=Alpinimonas psychrophila TaxID=748908 RepID=A0A7W3JTR6_9MICO|nr:TetR/AcrR family transcriptional regulator [Alpinimonas psychrophila]MBA8829002.1 AcrR family transcriptional regulator [Alpinimonas psychrophila]